MFVAYRTQLRGYCIGNSEGKKEFRRSERKLEDNLGKKYLWNGIDENGKEVYKNYEIRGMKSHWTERKQQNTNLCNTNIVWNLSQ
jgi:hypothetical protein